MSKVVYSSNLIIPPDNWTWIGFLSYVGVSMMKSRRNVKRLSLKRASLYNVHFTRGVEEGGVGAVLFENGTVEGKRHKDQFPGHGVEEGGSGVKKCVLSD